MFCCIIFKKLYTIYDNATFRGSLPLLSSSSSDRASAHLAGLEASAKVSTRSWLEKQIAWDFKIPHGDPAAVVDFSNGCKMPGETARTSSSSVCRPHHVSVPQHERPRLCDRLRISRYST